MPKRVDANQAEIVQALRGIGATVQHLHMVGKGCPDIMCGYRGHVWLYEIKTKSGKLTDDEKRWHDEWRGRVFVIRNAQQAIDMMTGYEHPDQVPPF